jgi:hypothetical protein
MAWFWRWLSGGAAVAALLYALALALSTLELSWRPEPFDTIAATTSEPGWVNEATYLMLNKSRFAEPANRIVITGASTARDPLRPDLIQARLPGWQVANASLSGAEIAEYQDLVDLYYSERARAAGGRTIWVFGMTFMQFRPSPYRNGVENPTAAEAQRAGLYHRGADGRLAASYPPAVEHAIELLRRPQVMVASWPRRIGRTLVFESSIPGIRAIADRFRPHDPVQRWTDYMRDANLDAIVIPPQVRHDLLARRLADAGGDLPSPVEEYGRFASLIRFIQAHGDKVVILELPMPDWHLAGFPRSVALHRAMMARLRQMFGNDRFGYLSMEDYDAGNDYIDSAHPKPFMWPIMSARLADWLRTSGLLSDSQGPR